MSNISFNQDGSLCVKYEMILLGFPILINNIFIFDEHRPTYQYINNKNYQHLINITRSAHDSNIPYVVYTDKYYLVYNKTIYRENGFLPKPAVEKFFNEYTSLIDFNVWNLLKNI